MLKFLRWARRIVVGLTVVLVVLLLAAGPGYRFGLWDVGLSLQMMVLAALVAVGIAALGTVTIIFGLFARNGKTAAPLIAVVIAAGFLFWVNDVRQTAAALPEIHDITTDLANPPQFAVIPPRTYSAERPRMDQAEYETLHLGGYPDIQPIILARGVPAATAKVADALTALGLEIVTVDTAGGRVEATDTTGWFGFKDDVVARVTAVDGGAKLDLRSVSRVGVSDLGVNANRIRKIIEQVMS